MKSEHVYNGEIFKEELTNFINPVNINIEIDLNSISQLFKDSETISNMTIETYYNLFEKYFSGLGSLDKSILSQFFGKITYTPHTNGYDFRFSPISFVNDIFRFCKMEKHIDFINLDVEDNKKYFIQLVRNCIKQYVNDNLGKKNPIIYKYLLVGLYNNIGSIVDTLYNRNINPLLMYNVKPKDMLFYLSYSSLLEYEKTMDENYLVMPYEYYHNVYKKYNDRGKYNSSYPHKLEFPNRGKLWFDDFAREYDSFVGKERIVNDNEYRFDKENVIIGCELLRPGEFNRYARDTYQRETQYLSEKRNINYDKYINLLNRKLNFYSNSDFNTFIKGELGLDGYIGFKYKNEYVVLDQLYSINKQGIRNLLIKPEAVYGIPSDKLSLIRYPKTTLIKEKKKDERIKRYYHTDTNSFENNINNLITGPNLSTSSFDEEIDKLSTKMLIKRL